MWATFRAHLHPVEFMGGMTRLTRGDTLPARRLRKMEPQSRLSFAPAEAASALGVSTSTIHRLIRTGALRAVRIGERRSVIPRDELERLLGQRSAHGRMLFARGEGVR
jgi:excisionase family DNA binding protein